MEITDPLVRNAEAFIVSGALRIWGDMREDGKDKLVWEFENCENSMGQISVRPKEVTRELVLRLFGLPRSRWSATSCVNSPISIIGWGIWRRRCLMQDLRQALNLINLTNNSPRPRTAEKSSHICAQLSLREPVFPSRSHSVGAELQHHQKINNQLGWYRVGDGLSRRKQLENASTRFTKPAAYGLGADGDRSPMPRAKPASIRALASII